MSEAREWIQWSVPMIGKMILALIGAIVFCCSVAYSAYDGHEQRIVDLELRQSRHDLILEQIRSDVRIIKEYVVAKEEKTKQFYERRPVFWEDIEFLIKER